MNPLPDRFEHLTFLGDSRVPPVTGTGRAQASRLRAEQVCLGPEGAAFFEALCRGWGLDAARYRESILSRRQGACLRALRATSPIEGAILVSRDQRASERALGAVMIGVTEFFRDAEVFVALRPLVRALPRDSVLSALSVGCSDGSELYSLGILLAEEGILDRSRLHGLDCRPAAIETARSGIYPVSAVAGIDASRRARFFVPATRTGQRAQQPASHVRIGEELRAACEWRVADAFSLEAGTGQPGMDIILCRNVAIYLKPNAVTELWARCVACLRPGGLLVTGKAERPPSEFRRALLRIGPCIYRKN